MYKNTLLLMFLTCGKTIFAQKYIHENVTNKVNQNVIHYLEKPAEKKSEIVLLEKDTPTIIPTKNKIINPYKEYLSSIPSIMPLQNINKKYFISSFYATRIHPIEQQLKMHYGIDLSAPKGTPVHATANGIVSNIYYNRTSIGYAIKIKHANNYSSLYGHLAQLPYLKLFDTVKRGQIIAYVGSTGLSTAPHLHYCIYYKKKPIDPLKYLSLIK